MSKFVLLLAVVVLAFSYAEAKGQHPPSAKWEDFKNFHSKTYESDKHEATHRANFEKNVQIVSNHNKAFEQGKVGYSKELNKFADIEPSVFRQRNGFKVPSGDSAPTPVAAPALPSSRFTRALTHFDWRDDGKVSPVKDQGQCGSCWSFSATGAMESQALINGKANKNDTFSEQQILDCDLFNGDYGCNGGMYTTAWKYIQKAGGIETEVDYAYFSGWLGFQGWCMFNKDKIVAKVISFDNVGNTDEALMEALHVHGPISVAIDAQDWQLAADGIYSCSEPKLDHAVLLVGYGEDAADKPYWIVKNSWGTSWGDKGYFKLARGKGDCGITQRPAYVKIE